VFLLIRGGELKRRAEGPVVARMPCQTGFTITEVLVSVGLVSVLMSLMLPAVQQARSASRSMQCRNNLHQLGIAAHNVHTQFGFLVTTNPCRRLLAPLGEMPTSALLDDFDKTYASGGIVDGTRMSTPSVLICTSDEGADARAHDLSYAVNTGATIGRDSGIRTRSGRIRFSDVTDGLSNSAFLAEKLVYLEEFGKRSVTEGRQRPLRYSWRTLREFGTGQEDELASHCLSSETRAISEQGSWTGNKLYFNGSEPIYNHLVPPNNWSFGTNGDYEGPISPTGNHAGAVNILLLDGSVQSTSADCDTQVFRAIGTINQGD
jgi:prepilin-type processing-associated H-X9-DG protein